MCICMSIVEWIGVFSPLCSLCVRDHLCVHCMCLLNTCWHTHARTTHTQTHIHTHFPHTLLLQVMLGGAWFEELFGSPDGDTCAYRVESAALKAVAMHLGITQDPSFSNVLIQKVLDLLSLHH